MGTSFTEYNGHGFWTRDWAIEAWLAALVVELQALLDPPAWLENVLDEWTLNAVCQLNGCVSPDLDWHLCEPQRVAAVLDAARAVLARLESMETTPIIADEKFAERAARVFGGEGWSRPESRRDWLLHVGRAFVGLLEAQLVAPPEASLFVGGDQGHYLGDPPTLAIRRWLLEAERGLPRGHTLDSLAEATHQAAGNEWRVDLKPRPAPALAEVTAQRMTQSVPPVTLIASRLGGFLSLSVGGEANTSWVAMNEQVPAAKHLLRSLWIAGWRYLPARELERKYDGLHARTGEARSWRVILFGGTPSGVD